MTSYIALVLVSLAVAWGAVDDSRADLGRHVFRVETRPADGSIEVPAGFPQIVRATVPGGDGPLDVPVVISTDASRITLQLPPAAGVAGKPLPVAVLTADRTGQFDDGRIVFTALDARVVGSKAKLETHPGNHRIGYWSNAQDFVEWDWRPTRWGMYDAVLTYSNASPDGTGIEVAIGDVKLPARLSSTGSWYRYATLPLGRVYVADAAPKKVVVRCTGDARGAVMNLKAISLEPACEGTPPRQADDGSVTLHGRDAIVNGTTLRYEPAEKKQTLGFWSRATDRATWTFAIDRPGTFDVEVLQGCGAGQGGSTMRIGIDAEGDGGPPPVEFVVEDTGGFQQFVPRIVGRVEIEHSGEHTLSVGPARIAKSAACDIRQIRLVRVAD